MYASRKEANGDTKVSIEEKFIIDFESRFDVVAVTRVKRRFREEEFFKLFAIIRLCVCD